MVLLKKTLAAELDELIDLERRMSAANCGLYSAWHCQHAPAVGVAEPLRLVTEAFRLQTRTTGPMLE